MDLAQALAARRTAHHYQTTPVPDGVVDEALALAHLAPCHKLTFPWRFVVVGPSARARLLAIDISLLGDAPSAARIEARTRKILDPPVLVVVTQKRCEDPFREREDYGAVSAAIQSLLVAFAAHGVDSKWSTGKLTRRTDAAEVLKVDLAREHVVGFVWAGFAAGEVGRPARPPIEGFVSRLP
jgi:nitroreductase